MDHDAEFDLEKFREVIALVQANPQYFPPAFESYLRVKANFNVYVLIENLAAKATLRHKAYGIDMLAGTVRWHTYAMKEEGTGYKVSNNMTAYMARLYHLRHPRRPIFRLKRTRHERDQGIMPPGYD